MSRKFGIDGRMLAATPRRRTSPTPTPIVTPDFAIEGGYVNPRSSAKGRADLERGRRLNGK